MISTTPPDEDVGLFVLPALLLLYLLAMIPFTPGIGDLRKAIATYFAIFGVRAVSPIKSSLPLEPSRR